MESEHYTVVVEVQARRAYAAVKATRPNLVILDLWMAGLSGWQVLDLLKGDPETASIPVLVCSAAGRELQAAEAQLRAQGCEILPKPFDVDELLKKVELLTR